MKKIIAFIICLIAGMSSVWFILLVITTPYAESGRWQFVLGLGISMLIGIICSGIFNSLPWKKDRK